MDSGAIIEVLSRNGVAAGVERVESGDGMPTIYVALDRLVETGGALRDIPELRFAFLADLLPVDYYPREPRFEIVYLLVCLGTGGFGDTGVTRMRGPGGAGSRFSSLGWPGSPLTSLGDAPCRDDACT